MRCVPDLKNPYRRSVTTLQGAVPCGATGIQAAARAHTIQIVIRTSFGQAHLVQADTIEATLIMVLLTQVMLLTSLQLMVCAVSLDLDFLKQKRFQE